MERLQLLIDLRCLKLFKKIKLSHKIRFQVPASNVGVHFPIDLSKTMSFFHFGTKWCFDWWSFQVESQPNRMNKKTFRIVFRLLAFFLLFFWMSCWRSVTEETMLEMKWMDIRSHENEWEIPNFQSSLFSTRISYDENVK